MHSKQVCKWHEAGENNGFPRVMLPPRRTWTGWRKGLTETSWSTARKCAKSCTSGGTIPDNRMCWGPCAAWAVVLDPKASRSLSCPQPFCDSESLKVQVIGMSNVIDITDLSSYLNFVTPEHLVDECFISIFKRMCLWLILQNCK